MALSELAMFISTFTPTGVVISTFFASFPANRRAAAFDATVAHVPVVYPRLRILPSSSRTTLPFFICSIKALIEPILFVSSAFFMTSSEYSVPDTGSFMILLCSPSKNYNHKITQIYTDFFFCWAGRAIFNGIALFILSVLICANLCL
ncbi:MAG: hypothetical protein MASP_01618 [Candidatus Methanolliviera sp. GoM_asphalt]|nr:MAG: hypothetical protein MASP_01618 [Candidatus Methanolliviera sp. GoM_asphalt]